ncbi:MAG: glycosyltransferase family 4 protein, partial [Rhodothermales bacterium]|nr:glycosyltransferase family 4 protein [Rhodothermales bacterium]
LTIHVRLPEKTLGERSTLFQGFAEASSITAVSHAIQLEIEKVAPSMATKVSTLYFGLQEAPLAPADLNFDGPTILCVGRLVAEKGFDVAIEAFARLREQYPGIRLEIAGDGPERTNLEAQATSLSVSDGVEFLGWVDPQKVPALMNTATIVVVPSRWREALGLVAIQAAQMGRPVVASRQSGLVEAVIDGETGILVPKDRPDILAESVADLLMNPERTRTMGRRARADALERFCFDRFVSEQYDLYRRILTTPG